jgi:hypothetical protein
MHHQIHFPLPCGRSLYIHLNLQHTTYTGYVIYHKFHYPMLLQQAFLIAKQRKPITGCLFSFYSVKYLGSNQSLKVQTLHPQKNVFRHMAQFLSVFIINEN